MATDDGSRITTIRVAVGSTLFSTFRGLDFGVEYNLAPGVGYLYTGMNSTQAPRLGVQGILPCAESNETPCSCAADHFHIAARNRIPGFPP